MLLNLSLENYKAFGVRQDIPLSKITLIFGANSSGKSSILQSLLLLKQTEESKNPTTPLLFKGSQTDQQSYSRCVHDRDMSKNISIGLEIKGTGECFNGTGENIFYSPRETNIHIDEETYDLKFKTIKPEHVCPFSVTYNYASKNDDVDLKSLNYAISNIISEKITLNMVKKGNFEDFKNKNNFSTEYVDDHILEYLDRIPDEILSDYYAGRIEDLFYDIENQKILNGSDYINRIMYLIEKDSLSDKFIEDYAMFLKKGKKIKDTKLFTEIFKEYLCKTSYLFSNQVPVDRLTSLCSPVDKKHLGNLNIISDYLVNIASPMIIDELKNMVYIGPLRTRPERFCDIVKDTHINVGRDGENTLSILYEDTDAVLNVNNSISRLGLNYEIKIDSLSKKDKLSFGNLYSLQIIDKKTNVPLTLCDVGFGISQILPILVQGSLPGSGSVLIEQPEIHLHPKMQAELGDFFIEQSKHKQFIIETHSEHLILRIMRRIRETNMGKCKGNALKIYPKDVSVLYVENINGESVVHHLRIDDDGDFIDSWPSGFFDERMAEIF